MRCNTDMTTCSFASVCYHMDLDIESEGLKSSKVLNLLAMLASVVLEHLRRKELSKLGLQTSLLSHKLTLLRAVPTGLAR